VADLAAAALRRDGVPVSGAIQPRDPSRRTLFRMAGIRRIIGTNAGYVLAAQNAGTASSLHQKLKWISRWSGCPRRTLRCRSRAKAAWTSDSDAKKKLLSKNWLLSQPEDGGRPWLGVGPGSKMAAKVWPEERFRETVQRLIDRFDLWPVVFGGAEDATLAARLIAAWKARLQRGRRAERSRIGRGLAALPLIFRERYRPPCTWLRPEKFRAWQFSRRAIIPALASVWRAPARSAQTCAVRRVHAHRMHRAAHGNAYSQSALTKPSPPAPGFGGNRFRSCRDSQKCPGTSINSLLRLGAVRVPLAVLSQCRIKSGFRHSRTRECTNGALLAAHRQWRHWPSGAEAVRGTCGARQYRSPACARASRRKKPPRESSSSRIPGRNSCGSWDFKAAQERIEAEATGGADVLHAHSL